MRPHVRVERPSAPITKLVYESESRRVEVTEQGNGLQFTVRRCDDEDTWFGVHMSPTQAAEFVEGLREMVSQ